MHQSCTVVGYLGKDPEVRSLPGGTEVCNFSVATTEKWKDRNGEVQEKTTWFRVSVFGRMAKPCGKYLSKGSPVLVEGKVDVSTYTGTDGTKQASLDLRANRVVFLPRRDGNSLGGRPRPQASRPADGPDPWDEFWPDDGPPF